MIAGLPEIAVRRDVLIERDLVGPVPPPTAYNPLTGKPGPAFAAAVLVGLVVLWPGGTPGHERTGVGFDRQTQQATVTKVDEVSCESVNASGGTPTGDTSTAEGSSAQQQANGTCKKATIRVDTGKDKGDKAKKGDDDGGDPCENGGKGWMNKINCALQPKPEG